MLFRLCAISVAKSYVIIIGVINLKIVTYFLSPAEYGLIGLFGITQSLLGLAVVAPCGNFLNRYTIEWYQKNLLKQKLSYLNTILLVASLIGACVVTLLYLRYLNVNMSIMYAIVFVINFYATTWISTFSSIITSLGYQELSSKGTLITYTLSSVCAISSILFIDKSPLIWIAGQTSGFFIGY